uniref:Uncharacterized protein n=1 Tax=Acrobeloides nanus TaxID=290746 RepID=A0A914EJU3_9BILA
MVSAAIIICQFPNTILFASFGRSFGQLFVLIDKYMAESDGMNFTSKNASMVYEKNGINEDRLREIDVYHDRLWTLFVAEVVELIFPAINLLLFCWLCPVLSLLLSISQAFMIYVTLEKSVFQIRFNLAKLISTLLEVNRDGRYPIESFFECEFFNDDDIVKPPCFGTIHEQVVSPTIIDLLIVLHVVPVVFCLYLLIKNLTNNKTEHLFLYIESLDPGTKKRYLPENKRTIKESLNDMLGDFDIKFKSKGKFEEHLVQVETGEKKKEASNVETRF